MVQYSGAFMQTFLPYPNFEHSVASLDYKRLGKQRVECSQILAALRSEFSMPAAWVHHPATLMWKGYESALSVYMTFCIREWIRRGYVNNMMLPYNEEWKAQPGFYPGSILEDARSVPLPPWIGHEGFHASHRAALLFKNEEYYRKHGWTEEAKYDYVWPTKEGLM